MYTTIAKQIEVASESKKKKAKPKLKCVGIWLVGYSCDQSYCKPIFVQILFIVGISPSPTVVYELWFLFSELWTNISVM